MSLFSHLKDVASGKVYRQNTLVGTHSANLLKRAMATPAPFIQSWLLAAAASTSSVMDAVLLGVGIGEKSTDPFNRFREQARKLKTEDTHEMVRIVGGYLLHEFVKRHDGHMVWKHIGLSPYEFRSAVQGAYEFQQNDISLWENLSQEEDATRFFMQIHGKVVTSVGLMPNPSEDLMDSLLLAKILSISYDNLIKSIESR